MNKVAKDFVDKINSFGDCIDTALDYVYDHIDDLLADENYEEVISIIEHVEPSSIDVSCGIGILVVTNPGGLLEAMRLNERASLKTKKDIYKVRLEFYNKLEKFLIEERGEEETRKTIFNLKPKK